MTADESTVQREKTYVNKLNLILVQILKQDWPRKWPTFITEIVGASRTNETLCENNMVILKLLSEEIFDFSAEQMVQEKAKALKSQMCGEFSEIFQLCMQVIETAQKPSLLYATLNTILRFLNWIPLGYVFETRLIENLVGRFLAVPMYRNVTLKCLTEIAALDVKDSYDSQFFTMFQRSMEVLSTIVPENANLADSYQNGSDEDQNFIQNLAMFITSFLKEHLTLLERRLATDHTTIGSSGKTALELGHWLLVKVSEVDEREVFKICLEYWSKLVAELYQENPFPMSMTFNPLLLGSGMPTSSRSRRQMYAPILSKVRVVMIDRMAKPEEVLVVENEEGEIVREFMKDSDTIALYKSMRECLVYLTHLDPEDTESIMTERLRNLVVGKEWSWNSLNKLCWAIGSISGAMSEDDEKRFLVIVIKDLLVLCEVKRGKDNKAVVAANIMYIVGQYPRFLRAHWKFLKTVVNKLFEFMHETHEGVQDMACDTFIKIAQKCRRHFVVLQSGEMAPFLEEILATLPSIISDLSPGQIHTFYEAAGYMLQAQTDKVTQEKQLARLMELPNTGVDPFANYVRSMLLISFSGITSSIRRRRMLMS